MSLVWGAEPTIQRPNFDKWKPDFNRGDATFDPDFDLANPEVCASLKCTKSCCTLKFANDTKRRGTLSAKNFGIHPVFFYACFNPVAHSGLQCHFGGL